MKPITIHPLQGLRGTIKLPGDKSISHRAAICAALSKGTTTLKNFLFSDDCLATLHVFKALGVKVQMKRNSSEVIIRSTGILHVPKSILDMKESGTSCRLLTGLLAAQNFSSKVSGKPSLKRRPMARILEPLRMMGADIKASQKQGEEFLPFRIYPAVLHGIEWQQKVPSAQVKSAILLAGLFAAGQTTVKEAVVSRDHTERMLKLFSAQVLLGKNITRIRKSILRSPKEVLIPGDISSAAFFMVAALLIKDSKILLKGASVNPTRVGIIHVLKRMGAQIRVMHNKNDYEPMADIEVKSSSLKGTVVKPSEIPSLIDELPILMVAAALASGKTVIEGAEELKVKEADRIQSMCSNLTKLGVNVKVKSLKNKVSLEILGRKAFEAASLKSFGDHRTAMSMVVAGLAANKAIHLDDVSCISKSFPEFLPVLKQLVHR